MLSFPTGSYWVLLAHIVILSHFLSDSQGQIDSHAQVIQVQTLRPGSLQDYEGVLWVKPMGSASVTLSLLVNDTLAGTETWPLPKVSQWQLGGS